MRLSIISGTILAALLMQTAGAQNDWPSYGHDPGANRYSTLSQITPANVSKLTQAWTFSARPSPDAKKNNYVSKTTPLVINGVMYFTRISEPGRGGARDRENIVELRSQAQHAPGARASPIGQATRPVRRPLFFGTDDGFLIALNAKTGKPVPGFANEGELELRKGMKDNYPNAMYGLNGDGRGLQEPGHYGFPRAGQRHFGRQGGRARLGCIERASWSGRSTQFLSRAKPAMRLGSTMAPMAGAGRTVRE